MNEFAGPLVSIVILNYNAEKFLDECISSIYQTEKINFEIIKIALFGRFFFYILSGSSIPKRSVVFDITLPVKKDIWVLITIESGVSALRIL